MSSRISFTIVKPLIIRSPNNSSEVTIPPGAVVEIVHPVVGDLAEIEYAGQAHMASLNNLLRACREDSRDR